MGAAFLETDRAGFRDFFFFRAAVFFRTAVFPRAGAEDFRVAGLRREVFPVGAFPGEAFLRKIFLREAFFDALRPRVGFGPAFFLAAGFPLFFFAMKLRVLGGV
ncbi:hypothetical protein BH18GEM1_BH18GEM1_07290 [soil metagenome]